MQYSKTLRLVLLGLTALVATPTFAAGTAAGATVTNAVTLDYTVNGGSLQETTSVDFVVDRKLSLVVASSDSDYVSVTTGQEFVGQTGVPALVFTVQNTGNSAADILLGVADKDGTAVTGFAGSPTGFFDEDALQLALDDNGNGVFDDGVDTVVPLVGGTNYYDLGSVAADATSTILLVVDVPAAAAADEAATYTLVATHHDGLQVAINRDDSGHIAPSTTAITPNDVADDPLVEQFVFADIAGADPEDTRYDFETGVGAPFAGADDASNGQHSDTSSFIITQIQLQVAKLVEAIYDPIQGNKYDGAGAPVAPAVNPKSIPGAVLMYVIGFQNSEPVAGVTIEDVQVADNLEDGATGADPEPIDEGNNSGVAVNAPASVTVDVDSGAGVNNVTFALPLGGAGAIDMAQVNTQDCVGTQGPTAYSGDTVVDGIDTAQVNPEIDVTIGDCAPQEDGYVIYFVTVDGEV
ncbi:MAG: hypothetical protein AAF515_02750 [Pseudomonadota bacterium]